VRWTGMSRKGMVRVSALFVRSGCRWFVANEEFA
jgi:hypothetical protein